ncbi:MAG: hypothetical protein HY057_12255, partial [Rhodospirillales bacterium]|nr:hypothetical protein [Rhodospirillales bacterium]
MTPRTTLAAIRAAGPCKDSWVALLAGLGKTEADDAPLSLLDALRILGLNDTLWVLCVVMGEAGRRLAAIAVLDFAERALPAFERERPGDNRPRRAIEIGRKFLRGEATADELRAAIDAAAIADDHAAAAADLAARDAHHAAACAAAAADLAARDAVTAAA